MRVGLGLGAPPDGSVEEGETVVASVYIPFSRPADTLSSLMASCTPSLDNGVLGSVVCWRQYKIHGKRTSKVGIDYDVEMRGNGKRKSEWIRFSDVDPHLIRQFNAKTRSERSQQKDVLEMVSERNSQTIFIISDAEDDDDEESVISRCSSDYDLNHQHDSPAAGCDTPRRSSRSRQINEKYKSYLSQRIRVSECEIEVAQKGGEEQHARDCPVLFHSSHSPPDDDSFQFVQMPPPESEALAPVRRPQTRSSGVHVPSSETSRPRPIKQTRTPGKRSVSANEIRRDSVRKSSRIQSAKSTTITLESVANIVQTNYSPTPSTESGPTKCKVFKTKVKPAPDAFPKHKRKANNTVMISDSSNESRKKVHQQPGTRSGKASGSTATCVSRGTAIETESTMLPAEADELGMIELMQSENHVQQSAGSAEAAISQIPAIMSSTSTPTTARRLRIPQTPMSERIVRTSTTKSGRKSISKIEDDSYVYDVNAILKEDAEIQRKTRAEESRIRKKTVKQPEFDLTTFYQSKSQAPRAPEAPFTEPSVRKVSEGRRKLFAEVPVRWNDIEISVEKQKATGSIPVEIKGEKFGNYVVEFSKGLTLGVPSQILEKHFPEEHKHLTTQRSLSRARPATPAYSQPRSPCSSLISPSTPRTPVAFQMDSEPPSPASKDGSSNFDDNVVQGFVTDRRYSVNSLISDIDMPEDEEIIHQEKDAVQQEPLIHPGSDPVCHEEGDMFHECPQSNGRSEDVAAGSPEIHGSCLTSTGRGTLPDLHAAEITLLPHGELDHVKEEVKVGGKSSDQEVVESGVRDTEEVATTSCLTSDQKEAEPDSGATLEWDAFVNSVTKEPPCGSDDIHLNGCLAEMDDM